MITGNSNSESREKLLRNSTVERYLQTAKAITKSNICNQNKIYVMKETIIQINIKYMIITNSNDFVGSRATCRNVYFVHYFHSCCIGQWYRSSTIRCGVFLTNNWNRDTNWSAKGSSCGSATVDKRYVQLVHPKNLFRKSSLFCMRKKGILKNFLSLELTIGNFLGHYCLNAENINRF